MSAMGAKADILLATGKVHDNSCDNVGKQKNFNA